MKKLIALLLLIATPAFADVDNPLLFSQEDGSDITTPYQVKVDHTDNGDGTITISAGGGGTPGGSSGEIQFNNSGSFGGVTGSSVSGSQVTFGAVSATDATFSVIDVNGGTVDATRIGSFSAADATFSAASFFATTTSTGVRGTGGNGILTFTEMQTVGTKRYLSFDLVNNSRITVRANRSVLLWRGDDVTDTFFTSFSANGNSFLDSSSNLSTAYAASSLYPEGSNDWQWRAGGSSNAGADYLALFDYTKSANVLEVNRTTGNFDFNGGSLTDIGGVSATDATFTALQATKIGNVSAGDATYSTIKSNGQVAFGPNSNFGPTTNGPIFDGNYQNLMNVQSTTTGTASGRYFTHGVGTLVNPGSTSSQETWGSVSWLQTAGTSNITASDTIGHFGWANHAGSGNLTGNLSGIDGEAAVDTNGRSSGHVSGVQGLGLDYSTNTVSNLNSFLAQTVIGGTGTITNMSNFRALATSVDNGTNPITNWYGLKVDNSFQLGSNNYAVHTAEASGDNNFNIYSGGTAKNYFAGNVGVKTTTPTYDFDVTGSIRATGSADLGSISATDVTFSTLNATKIGNVSSGEATFSVINGTRIGSSSTMDATFSTINGARIGNTSAKDASFTAVNVSGQITGKIGGSSANDATFTSINAPGAGANSQRIGLNADSAGANSVVIGNNTYTDADSVAIGDGAYAVNSGGSPAVAIGRSAGSTDLSVAIGDGAMAVGSDLVLGASATSASGFNVLLGQGTSGGIQGVCAGFLADCTGSRAIAIGNQASATATRSLVIGPTSSSALSDTIIIGGGATAAAANTMQIGGAGTNGFTINRLYIGEGFTSTSATSPSGTTVIAPTGGSGSNNAARDLVLAGGVPTGSSATGGNIRFETPTVGTSGSTVQNLSERMRIAQGGKIGIGTTTPTYGFDVNTEIRGTGTLTMTTTTTIGWTTSSTTNQSCSTTCTYGAVFGWDAGATTIVGPTDATADVCVCAGPG